MDERIPTGLPGLDEILHGGLIPGRNYLVWGGPGTGKTTLGFHFLRGGRPARNLFVTLGETEAQLRDNAARVDLPLDEVRVLDLSPASGEDAAYNVFESWEVEGGGIHDRIVEDARQHASERVFIDSLSQLRYLTPDAFQFRKQVLSLLRRLTDAGATVLFTAEVGEESADDDLEFLSDGVVRLRREEAGCTLSITKLRGSGFAEGSHHYALGAGGMTVFPRLAPADHGQAFRQEPIGSGVAGIDALTGGGLDRGTVTILSGPSGVGKTTLGAHFMHEAARHGERSVIYSFDEGRATFVHRLGAIGLPAADMLDGGELDFRYIEPLHYSPDRFAMLVRDAVERRGVRIVMLDSLAGYRQSMHGADMVERVHALCRYLVNMGVTVILVSETHGRADEALDTTQDGISYLADTLLLQRFVEIDGELHKTIGVLKKRTGDFEKRVRRLDITADGIRVGEPLRGRRSAADGAGAGTGRGGG